MNALYNIHRKPWFNEATSLDQLITDLLKIRDGLNGQSCQVIIVNDPGNPVESELIAVRRRSELLDQQVGKHLNRFGSEVSDAEIVDSSEDAEHQASLGEVIYLVAGVALCSAPPECYEA